MYSTSGPNKTRLMDDGSVGRPIIIRSKSRPVGTAMARYCQAAWRPAAYRPILAVLVDCG